MVHHSAVQHFWSLKSWKLLQPCGTKKTGLSIKLSKYLNLQLIASETYKGRQMGFSPSSPPRPCTKQAKYIIECHPEPCSLIYMTALASWRQCPLGSLFSVDKKVTETTCSCTILKKNACIQQSTIKDTPPLLSLCDTWNSQFRYHNWIE